MDPCNFKNKNSTAGPVLLKFVDSMFLNIYSRIFPTGIYLLKVNNRNTRTRFEICSKLTIKIPERRHGIFIENFEHISHLVLVFLLLNLSRQMPATLVLIVYADLIFT